MDGSFSLEYAAKRFLARCPELASFKELNDLVKTGHMIMEREVVNVVAELFLHPVYTIRMFGCFRQIARVIVEEAIALLSHCNLNSDTDDMMEEQGDFPDEDVHFIKNYDKSGRGLKLHEFACLAFCRVLDLDSSLWGSISVYFKFSPPPFERILREGAVLKPSKVAAHLLALRISYRFLLMEPKLSKLWDWSCFVDLVNQSGNLKLPLNSECDEIADIRWCCVQILSVVLKLGDPVIENFGLEAEESASCFLRWEEFCADVAIEKLGSYIASSEQAEVASNSGDIDFSLQKGLAFVGLNSLNPLQRHEIEPTAKRRRFVAWDGKSGENPFVVTSTVKKSFEMVLFAVSQKWPVLLYGPAGAGKTALISKLARDTGNQVLLIHMDDQIDGKTLIGTYVSTEQPGEFRWQPGSLVQAVLNGYWVVFEGIDKASSDVQSILLPLLEGASSFLTSQGEEIQVAESFRLFSTISTSKSDIHHCSEGGILLSTLWRKVMVGMPNYADMESILRTWYPNLDLLAGKLIETFERVNYAALHHFRDFESGNSASSSLCRFSLRDLLKWCKRIAGLGFGSMGILLTAYQCRCIYQEGVDIFAAFLMSAENQLAIFKEIAKVWQVPLLEAEVLHPSKPEIQVSPTELRIGRVTLECSQIPAGVHRQERLVQMRSSLCALERIASSYKYNEPVLLVGETGTGKTTLVQSLALMLGQRLTVLNLSQQSDVTDLLGGFKPVDPQSICLALYKEFKDLLDDLLSTSPDLKVNDNAVSKLQQRSSERNWKRLLQGLVKCVDSIRKTVEMDRHASGKKRKSTLKKIELWENLSAKLETAKRQLGASSGMIFSFVEGAFVTALRNGEWILLDEVNLAPPETLQRVVGVLEGEYGSLCLAERGDVSLIPRHQNFRIFACMNPATDAGKRDLPHTLRSRFTEYFVDDLLDKEDLKLFINKFMEESRKNCKLEKNIIDFYEGAKRCSEERLQDGANQKPQYSLRSLYRALEYIREAKGRFGFQKSVHDGFSMFFLTLLDRPSAKVMKKMIKDKLLGGEKPKRLPFKAYLGVDKVTSCDEFLDNYVLTKSVEKQLGNLARAVYMKRYPVLLQGPTSSGKTSLVQYLATITGHKFVRINNHEHTDLQEYLGSYISDSHGKLVFHEGALVKAVRDGQWIVLDELNLAPSDVLEALNRLLDDNRELFVPELRETIRAHPNFMLFATQNPPTFYGGRKMLSRAFRNRFVEVHVEEIPDHELSTIIEKRCRIPGSRAKIMVEVMKELQLRRQSSKVFAGKHGFITPRDLFRWANRLRTFGDSKEVMAEHGYYLLADRLRDKGERHVVQEVLEKHLRVQILRDDLYKESIERDFTKSVQGGEQSSGGVISTRSMTRLYSLVKHCYQLREPVLLVGETGGGKTTVCQLLSSILNSKLHILNCHQYTETSDFLGGFYPIRERSKLSSEFKYVVEKFKESKTYMCFPENMEISSDIGRACSTLNQFGALITKYRQGQVSCTDVTSEDLDTLEQMKFELALLYQKWQTIFMWQDGPLVQAMKDGDLFLIDEISLADDSVLERLNSVLEPERKLSLAEKGGSDMEEITANENFFLLATMNPGGDYGKKELSPALRNRFTEIWVPSVGDIGELKDIASKRLSNIDVPSIVDALAKFWEWFNELQTGRMLTVRDLLSWVEFINLTKGTLGTVNAFIHGIFLVLLDGLSLGTGISRKEAAILRERCLSFILNQLELDNAELHRLSNMQNYGWGDLGTSGDISGSEDTQCDDAFGISPFFIEKGNKSYESGSFEFLAPTTRRNAMRVLRAMQLSKPVLLEGSPGVGKTSLISALGKISGHKVVRINLCEQTDLMDLLGSDLPVESDEGMKFAWSDGILLQALKEGCWVLLDELNLASQSVLEGLNAILDHRAEVFIPELGCTFKCPTSFRVFACQNPLSQGGGRKGLPRSFLNRFTKVYVDELVEDDYLFICSSLYPSIPRTVLSKLILFNKRLHEDTMIDKKFAQDGSPWEFNLRDVIRSCQVIQDSSEGIKVEPFLNILYIQRMRTAADRKEVLRIYEEVFGHRPFVNPYPRVHASSQYLSIGDAVVKRNKFQSSKFPSKQLNILPSIRHSLESVAHCVQHQWLSILIGPPSSGKTSLIRLLAQLTGNVLNELHLSSTTDISELVGCFEQYNASRNLRLVVAQVERYVNEFCNLQLERSKVELVSKNEDLIKKWLTLSSRVDSSILSSSASNYLGDSGTVVYSLTLIAEVIEQLKSDVASSGLPVSWSSKELNSIMKVILKLQEDQQRKPISAKFEWVSGVLIKAIENGEWIVLENANLCNPTVLDRINSLVEPSGSITVNECGIVDGNPLVLHPHPNFNIFLTVDPSYGEVSRAMRNRGVEIYMMQPHWLLEEGKGYNCADIELEDVKRFLVLSGVPVAKLIDSMSKAHTYARNKGLKFNVQITYLELARWVQLFQQLIISGNPPLWSLQISWEHSYLCSLGESWGCDIVNQAKTDYLSNELLECSLPVEFPFYLPGGWPMPLKLTDFMLYSREAAVKQNCAYLEHLVAQYGSGVLLDKDRLEQVLSSTGHLGAYLIDRRIICQLMFPEASNRKNFGRIQESDMKSAKKNLFFAASWTIEQATEIDYKLYLLRFRWFSSKLQRFCPFFYNFQSLLEQEFKHPIWECIFDCHRELARLYNIGLNLRAMPLLSFSLANVMESNELSKPLSRLLFNAINCVGLLRHSYHQWSAQDTYEYSKETLQFKPILEGIQVLENEVLSVLFESPSYDLLIRLYGDLLEDHITFWDALTSSHFEHVLVCWRSLMKNVSKMRDFYPAAVGNILMMAKRNLDRVFSQDTEQSLLWINGGHPSVPASAKLYHKQHELLELCESIWPTKADPNKQVDDSFIKVVASANPDLRFLAVQGICMSSYITTEYDEYNVQVVQQLEEMNQDLLERFETEKSQVVTQSDESTVFEKNSATCCVYVPGILGTKSSFVSWQETLPIIDITSLFLDMELLQKLSSVVLLDPEGLQLALSGVSKLLESSFKYSLTCSSRPPQTLTPHQKILWTLEAWLSVNAVNSRIASYILEMWLAWHSSLWTHYPVFAERFSRLHGHDVPLTDMLIMPVKTASIMHTLQSASAIKDYFGHCLKLRATTRNLWQSPLLGTNAPSFLLSSARLIFQQIIYAHAKSFDVGTFAAIMSIFKKNITMQEDIQRLSKLISLSRHQGLKSSLPLLIDPMLGELYLHSSTDLHSDVGYAWLRIGGLRFRLLLGSDNLDPAMKYSFKYSQLEEKITSLALEIKVRQECDYLAGLSSSREADEKRKEKLKSLENELKRLQRKMVFRCNPSKFNVLRKECEEFFRLVLPVIDMVCTIGSVELKQVVDHVCNWQETATCFIDRLADEYKDYIDVTQPIQVAVYEMKLGLSLVLSGALQRKVLNTIREDNIDRVMESIYSFMKFPRGYMSKSIYSDDVNIAKDFWKAEISVLEKLVLISSDIGGEKTSLLQPKVHQNFLLHVAHFVADTQRIDGASFETLDRIFHEFSCMWMNMKEQIRSKEGFDTQEYKFRPRAFEIKKVVDVDISSFGKLFSNDTFSEWHELLSEEECVEKMEADESQNFEEEWNFTLEPILTNIICVHNQLFGSTSLVSSSGRFHISYAERLLSFANCYTMGAGMVSGLGGLYSSTLDTRLMPEHVLRLCLKHEEISSSRHKSSTNYNFYKDSNASEMVKMVKLLTNLRQKISDLLCDWEDHPALLKIMDAVDMLLAIPISTPLAKALLGLQFLLNRVTALQENGSKFFLSDLLEPISSLMCSWQKVEFDSWPALLDEVQDNYENNAAKLWFPLFSVLHHSHSADVAGYEQSTIESLEEFIRTSSIGEFRKRLQLLFAFHGQITAGRCLEVETYLSSRQEQNLNILYNLFGYYVQFLPRILEHINAKRRDIEKELKELLKLCRWERTEVCLHFENSKRTRHKLKKLIQKYSDLLQQPVMIILNQDVEHKGMRIQPLQGSTAINDLSENNPKMFKDALDLMEFCDKDRSLWFPGWKKRVNVSLSNLGLGSTSGLNFLGHEDATSSLLQCLESDTVGILHQEQWDVLGQTLENLFRCIVDSDQLWRDIKRSFGKKRAFSELLKLLESSGLQKHKFEIMNMSNSSNWFFIQPSYDAEHLLPTESRLTRGASDVANAIKLQCFPDESLDIEWKIVNEYYFKCMASLQILQRICLKPHEDITYEQVTRSVSFLNHLMFIQQTQRTAAYDFAKHLKCLRESLSALENLYSNCNGSDGGIGAVLSSGENQSAIFKCMWKQKHLFDALNAMVFEVSVLLRTVESTHLSSCQNVKPEATRFLQVIGNFAPVVRSSKDSLDKYLVSPQGPMQTVIQESLDKYLLGRVGAKFSGPFRPFIISRQMKQLVQNNFEVLKGFEEQLLRFRDGDLGRNSVIQALLGHFDDAFNKGKVLSKHFDSAIKAIDQSKTQEDYKCKEKYSTVETELSEALKRVFVLIMDVFKKLCISSEECAVCEVSSGTITTWEHLFKSSASNLNMEEIYDNLLRSIFSVEKLLGRSFAGTSPLSFQCGPSLERLRVLLELVFSFSDSLLKDLLTIHKRTSVVTHVLAETLASLFSKGFGAKEEVDDTGHGISKDASGTGMGEGSGLNDVSDQITDEDQLLGTSEKPDQEHDVSGEIADKNEKGIEMEQDFEGDMVNISEDSGDEDDEDGEAEQLESKMGEAGAESEVVDEKLWDKEEDEDPNNMNEKYESGTAVRDMDPSGRELRAKEEPAATADDELGELGSEQHNGKDDEVGEQDDDNAEENMDDTMKKEEALADPTGLMIDESNESFKEDMELDENSNENDSKDSREEIEPEGSDEFDDSGKHEEHSINPADEAMAEVEVEAEADREQEKKTAEGSDPSKDNEQNPEANHMEPRKEMVGQGVSESNTDNAPNASCATQQISISQELEFRNAGTETNMTNSSEAYNDLANLPNGVTSEMDIMYSDASDSRRFTDHQSPHWPQKGSSDVQKALPNPYRNVGDALKEWKERVKVCADLQADNVEVPNEVEDDNANEYGFVSEFERGTAQALGPATAEQIDANVNGEKPDKDLMSERDDITDMEIAKQTSEEMHLERHASVFQNTTVEQMQTSDFETSLEEVSPKVDVHADGDLGNLSESLISVKKFFPSENMYQTIKPWGDDDDLGKSLDFDKVSLDSTSDATALWRRYELLTTRLSQELAEQLRLVLEPTVASKLQGDYKTGKRINMKRLLRYIASDFRQDKIWLRRTRPNKRDYQIVIAVDDSRSMSENSCGDVAIESLVTVCRAMSQLEMGNLAVTSFGKKGNIRLLHDFDHPFTGEAGMKIISSLTFEQENTIADEPVLDLLKYLNNMLDSAVAKAWLPSGQNPLQQLVLIIADGRFHEKEKLKRYVRDFVSRKRMVAFLLLDSPKESIVDQMEASFVGEGERRVPKFTKYLDSFPFPYYIVLRNIEALPRTLADLLRQWFEVMQYSRE